MSSRISRPVSLLVHLALVGLTIPAVACGGSDGNPASPDARPTAAPTSPHSIRR